MAHSKHKREKKHRKKKSSRSRSKYSSSDASLSEGEERSSRSTVSSRSSKNAESSGESDSVKMDLKVELHPIEKYIRNRSEMLSQVFQCVKGAQFRKMIPDILKDIPIDKLKELCLEELEGMSKKRIRHVLSGVEMTSSSSSEESDSEVDEAPKKEADESAEPLPDSTTAVGQLEGIASSPTSIELEKRRAELEEQLAGIGSSCPSGNEATPEIKRDKDEEVATAEKSTTKKTPAVPDAAVAPGGAIKGTGGKRDEFDLGSEPEIELDFDEDLGRSGEEEEKPVLLISDPEPIVESDENQTEAETENNSHIEEKKRSELKEKILRPPGEFSDESSTSSQDAEMYWKARNAKKKWRQVEPNTVNPKDQAAAKWRHDKFLGSSGDEWGTKASSRKTADDENDDNKAWRWEHDDRYPSRTDVRSATPEDGEIDSGDETAPPAAGELRMDAEVGRVGSTEAMDGSDKSTPPLDVGKVGIEATDERQQKKFEGDFDAESNVYSAEESNQCLPVDLGNTDTPGNSEKTKFEHFDENPSHPLKPTGAVPTTAAETSPKSPTKRSFSIESILSATPGSSSSAAAPANVQQNLSIEANIDLPRSDSAMQSCHERAEKIVKENDDEDFGSSPQPSVHEEENLNADLTNFPKIQNEPPKKIQTRSLRSSKNEEKDEGEMESDQESDENESGIESTDEENEGKVKRIRDSAPEPPKELEEGECSDDEIYEGPENCPIPLRPRSSESGSSEDFTEKIAEKRSKKKREENSNLIDGPPDDPEVLEAENDQLLVGGLKFGSKKSVHSSARILPSTSSRMDPNERNDQYQYDSEGGEDADELPPPPGSDAKGQKNSDVNAGKKSSIVPAKLLFQQLKEQRMKPKQQPKLYHAADRPRVPEAQVSGPALPPSDEVEKVQKLNKKPKKAKKISDLTPEFYKELKAKETSYKNSKSAMNEKLEALKAQRLALEHKQKEAAELAMKKAKLAAAAATQVKSEASSSKRVKKPKSPERKEKPQKSEITGRNFYNDDFAEQKSFEKRISKRRSNEPYDVDFGAKQYRSDIDAADFSVGIRKGSYSPRPENRALRSQSREYREYRERLKYEHSQPQQGRFDPKFERRLSAERNRRPSAEFNRRLPPMPQKKFPPIPPDPAVIFRTIRTTPAERFQPLLQPGPEVKFRPIGPEAKFRALPKRKSKSKEIEKEKEKSKKAKKHKKEKKTTKEVKEEFRGKAEIAATNPEDPKIATSLSSTVTSSADAGPSTAGKKPNDLELYELEMRARAIRALMKSAQEKRKKDEATVVVSSGGTLSSSGDRRAKK